MNQSSRHILARVNISSIPLYIRWMVGISIAGVLFVVLCVYFESYALTLRSYDFNIPSQSDWVDYGQIFTAGDPGEWDYYLYGGFTVSVVKKDDGFYLYYQGASGYRTTPDETVTWRAIGVATSKDGKIFTKSPINPLITWFPNGNGEEGAVSAGTALDSQGNIVVHYGANTGLNETSVNADARVAISKDGFHFTDRGAVLRHDDPSVWGYGDEIFPILTIQEKNQWLVYYLPNGVKESDRLAVAWGDQYNQLTKSAPTRSGLSSVKGWGTGSAVKIGTDTYALFINNVRTKTITIYLMSVNNPTKLSIPVQEYQFDEVFQASFYLDRETSTWYMFYRGINYYGVKIAHTQR